MKIVLYLGFTYTHARARTPTHLHPHTTFLKQKYYEKTLNLTTFFLKMLVLTHYTHTISLKFDQLILVCLGPSY